MLTIEDRPYRCCDGVSRRDWLRIGALSAFGVTWPGWLRARAAGGEAGPASFGRAKACIVLFLFGGPPQHETWDPKPEAPSGIRGEYQPIATSVPGLRVGELMPRVSRLTHRIAVLRAMSSRDNAHSSSGYWMLTGYPHQPMNAENSKPGPPNDRPCVGAMVRHLRRDRLLPAAMTLPEELWNTGRIVWPGQTGGWLGRSADPWLLTCDPNAPDFRISGLTANAELPPLRLQRRQSLLQQVDRHLGGIADSGALAGFDALTQQAFDLLRSPVARRAFDLDQEPSRVRDRYGRHRFGQSVLLARRLVEAGVAFVQVNWTRTKEDTNVAPVWDTHADNAGRLKTALMPPMDLAYSALLEDLDARGLLDETLVVWMGEFGRTPKINARGGRDHWGHVYSVALAGGGVRGGVVHGSSDRLGAQPKDGRVQPWDLTATVFHCLGYRPETELHDPVGRPSPISRGQPITPILL